MISLYNNTDDPFGLYGINHFIKKFGIPVVINKPSKSGVVIAYGVKASGNFVISVEENEIKNSICGQISTPHDKIPLCEMPADTGSEGEVIAHFETDTRRYPCITRNDQGFCIGMDIFRETGYQLSGHLDSIRPSLDSTTRKQIASKPCVDFLEKILFDAIRTGCNERQIPLIQKSYWPDGKKFAVCLTHDVDEIKKTYQWITRPLRFLAHRDFLGFTDQLYSFVQYLKGEEPYFTYDDLINVERNLGVKSTYFILKESGYPNLSSKDTWYLFGRNRSLQSPEMRALIQRLASNGDEIAIHGSYFSFKDPAMLKEETRELEQLIGTKVIGTRQHNLNLQVPETWNCHLSAGLEYDTTLGFIDTIGFKWGTSFPFFPNSGEGPIRLLEIPLIIMDICLEFSENKEYDCLQIADETEKYHGVLTLLWHPPVFNTLEYPFARDMYIKINKYCQEKGAWAARACDIHEWIKNRTSDTFTYCYDISTHACKIVPTPVNKDHFFSIYIPSDKMCCIRSGNAIIIKNEEDCVHIKTQALQENNEILLEIYDH